MMIVFGELERFWFERHDIESLRKATEENRDIRCPVRDSSNGASHEYGAEALQVDTTCSIRWGSEGLDIAEFLSCSCCSL